MLHKLKLLTLIFLTTTVASYGGVLVGETVNCLRASGDAALSGNRIACTFNYDDWTASRLV